MAVARGPDGLGLSSIRVHGYGDVYFTVLLRGVLGIMPAKCLIPGVTHLLNRVPQVRIDVLRMQLYLVFKEAVKVR